MPKINRNNPLDAKLILEKFVSDTETRNHFIFFLIEAINYTNELNSENWNLNLDKNGQFLRFNVGHEFCIELTHSELLILCDRITIENVIIQNKIPVIYRGYSKEKGNIRSTTLHSTPDLLSGTKNSIGCIITHNNILPYINYFKNSNNDFIESAIKTRLMPIMRRAHSIGAIEYLFSHSETKTILFSYSDFLKSEESQIQRAKKINSKERLEILAKSNRKPQKKIIQQFIYQRNPYVVAEALYRANGKCERCKKNAPFIKDNDNTPYLEVHHIIPLSEDGDDILENVIALCPNCHRHAHYGKNSY